MDGLDSTLNQLESLLKTGTWTTADQVTGDILVKLAQRETEGWIDLHNVERLPCESLQCLDHLWVRYSNERFGFSIQKQIWEAVQRDYQEFGLRVGWKSSPTALWKSHANLTFDLTAPLGHLPSLLGFRLKAQKKVAKTKASAT